jgi:acyl-CoA synthetase (AMP-forming)/AMP-acid ligase II
LNGLMMDFPLTLDVILRRAATIHGEQEVVSILADKSSHRYTYAEMAQRAKRLAVGLRKLGVKEGDRVATLGWNHYRHLEAYFGVPISGAVLHTLNLRLHPDDLAHIVNEAEDKVLIVDESLLGIWEQFCDRVEIKHLVVVSDEGNIPDTTIGYEELLDGGEAESFDLPTLQEGQAASMCYTSGTAGKPKGVMYSHRAITLHTLAAGLTNAFGIWEEDCILPAVPMFHVNAWGLPYLAAMMGAKLVLPGPHLDADSLLEAFHQERVTISAGVPTIWLAVLGKLDADPQKYDLAALRKMFVGGSATPKSLMQAFEERHNLTLVPAWGMTETTPLGTVSHPRPRDPETTSTEEQYTRRTRQGSPVPFVEIRARGSEGIVPWDGKTMGELEVRGPWIAKAYYQRPDASDRFTEDGWFRTGDIVSINPDGCLKIEDREKDLIKSGGEWISSLDLENAIMAHPAVAEAAVIAMPHPKWDERPLAVVVVEENKTLSEDELRTFLEPKIAKWWIPDVVKFVDEIPKTSVGKFKKAALRKQFVGS